MDGFPTEAAYGVNTPEALSKWDGRSEEPQTAKMTGLDERMDDDSLDDDHGDFNIVHIASRDDEGNSSNAVEVTCVLSPRSLRNHSLPSWPSNDNEEDEPTSPHIDISFVDGGEKQPLVVNSMCSHDDTLNSPTSMTSGISLLHNLSDIENSLTSDVSKVKVYLSNLKADRDKLRRENASLAKELSAERQCRTDTVDKLQSELANHETKQRCLQEELDTAKTRLARDTEKKNVSGQEAVALRQQLDASRQKVSVLEETLLKEKSTSTLREANKIEEARKEAFANQVMLLKEVESKFQDDMKCMTEQKQAELEDERAAHEKTRSELNTVCEAKDNIERDLVNERDAVKKYEHSESLRAEELDAANKALSGVRFELSRLQTTHECAKRELEEASSEKVGLASKLTAQSDEIALLKERANASHSSYLLEHERMKEQMKNMCMLVEDSSNEREALQNKLKESSIAVETLTTSNSSLTAEVETLKDEITALNDARRLFEQYEKESKDEISRLQQLLEESTQDILKECQSSSEESITTNVNAGTQSDSSKPSLPLAVPNLSERSTAQPEQTGLIREQLAIVEKERDELAVELEKLKKSTPDALRRMVESLKPVKEPTAQSSRNTSSFESDDIEQEVSDLRDKLAKAEGAFVKAEVDKCERLAVLSKERDDCIAEITSLRAELLAAKLRTNNEAIGCEEVSPVTSEMEQEVERMEQQLDSQVLEIEQLEANELKEQLNAQVHKNEELAAEVNDLNAALSSMAAKKNGCVEEDSHTVNGDAIAEYSERVESIKQEHRIEIKLLKQTHAELKTQYKVLGKEKDELTKAFEIERASNNELETSLEEMVNLLQAERSLYVEKTREHKLVKKKFSALRKKRVPIDAAYQACRALLERREECDSTVDRPSVCRNSSQDVLGAIKHIERLAQTMDDSENAESSLASTSSADSISSSKNMQELARVCEVLELKVRAAKMDVSRGKVDPSTSAAQMKKEAQIASLRKANKSLKDKSNNLTKELVDSTTAFEETIAQYESVIAKVKDALSMKKKENESLKKELSIKVQLSRGEEENRIAKLAEAHEAELLSYREAVGLLEKKLEEKEPQIEELENEVSRLKSDFAEVINQFEQELTSSCNESDLALKKKQGEVRVLESSLAALQVELEGVRKELMASSDASSNAEEKASQHETTVQRLRSQLGELELSMEDERREQLTEIERMKSTMAEAESSHQTELEGLQKKLDRATSSLDENMTFYEQLREDCSKIKEAKEAALDEVDALTAKIGSLTGENGHLRSQLEAHKQAMDNIEDQLGNIRGEIKLAEEARATALAELQRVNQKLNNAESTNHSLEGQLADLREAMDVAAKEKRESTNKADELKIELQQAQKRLDDMVVFTDSLKKEYEDHTSSMKKAIQSLETNANSIQAEKEENRRMYKTELDAINKKHAEAISNLDSLSDLVKNLKSALESEKENAQLILTQFKKSEQNRQTTMKQKGELEDELTLLTQSENSLKERVRHLERAESELARQVTAAESLGAESRAKEKEYLSMKTNFEKREDEANRELAKLLSLLDDSKQREVSMLERFKAVESHTQGLQTEFKQAMKKKDDETAKLRVVLQEARAKLEDLWDENEALKTDNNESMESLNAMLNDAIRSRAETDASLQESLQLLEQQKRLDIKRKSEISKLEQTVDVLKSKERYQEKYIESLKGQLRC
ncbi:hypothetical protein THAOC_30258 [Thalassiosira oceanica]|uniref:Uncharacterized protein n=1 Tax=Thalassiosira oceanica TaxID=159749 RepID=K0RC01_THAOC|nr:hypothetical protein THAOC_30258 [Thalassiosira oceanica]|eukprot:EJK50700.1 hypothetical protein THAOC_30258 [Thalassiosira oceanica]